MPTTIYHRGLQKGSSLVTLDNCCCRKILPMAGSLPTSKDDELHASLTCLLIFGLLFLSVHQFEGDRFC
jgi:hypothetical protein